MNKLFPQHNDHPLFRYFTDDERRKIEKIGEVKTVRANDYLIRARAHDSTLYTIEEGHLDIVAKESVVATVGPGDVLGEVSFIDDSPRTVSVRAGRENAVVRGWDRKTLSEALAFDPQLLAKFSVALCELLVTWSEDRAEPVPDSMTDEPQKPQRTALVETERQQGDQPPAQAEGAVVLSEPSSRGR